jgi:hypothetical protein
MSECGRRATLVVTRSVKDTATNVARLRLELTCRKPSGHPGLHEDAEHNESWEERPGGRTTLLRHEDES